MARKTKPIAKNPKAPARSEEAEEEEEVFSQSFRDRLDQFSQLTKEVLSRKAQSEGSSANQEIKARQERVSQRVEAASAAILKEELQTLEEWIAEKRKTIANQIKGVQKAHEAVEDTLEATGSFSAEEIAAFVAKIEERADELRAGHDGYVSLLAQSKKIYN